MLRPFRVSILLAILLIGGLAGGAAAATIRGAVTDPHDRPVAGARVLVTAAGAVVASAETGATGRYEVTNLPAGAYVLQVAAPGFRGEPVAVRLASEADARTVAIPLALAAVNESVVVSASHVEVPLSEVPDSVTVLTRADLEAHQIDTVVDALRLVPGLTVTQSGGPGGITSIFPRGGESDFTLVLVDGVEVNSFGGGFDFSELPLAGIQRIEVVRGPESAIYGAGAIGAVVQIVTRKGGPPAAGASVETGGLGTTRVTASTSGSAGPWRWGLAGERLASDGFRGVAPANGQRVSNDDYDGRHASASGGWQGADGAAIGGTVRIERTVRGYPGPYGSDPAGLFPGVDTVSRGWNDRRVYGLNGSFAPTSRVRPSAAIWYTTLDSRFRSPYDVSTSASRRLAARGQVDVRATPAVGFSTGVELLRERAESTYITGAAFGPIPVERSLQGVFVEGRGDAGARLFVTAGVRAERIHRDALEPDQNPWAPRPAFPAETRLAVTPKVSAAFFLQAPSARTRSWTKLKASAGTGIRPPDAFEIAFTDNPALKPERSRSVDAGVEQALAGGAVRLDATFFANRYDDLIVAVGRSLQDASKFRTDNISNARARGLELTAAVRPSGGIEATFTYTLLDTTILSADGLAGVAPAPFSVGDPLIRRPRHQASLDVVLHHGRLDAFARVGGRGRMLDAEPNLGVSGGLFESHGYVVADAGASFALGGGLELVGRVTNVFDRPYEETLGYPAPPRAVFVGVRFAHGR